METLVIVLVAILFVSWFISGLVINRLVKDYIKEESEIKAAHDGLVERLRSDLANCSTTINTLHQDVGLLEKDIKDRDAEINALERALDASVDRENELKKTIAKTAKKKVVKKVTKAKKGAKK